jgi:hypothetical protein
MKREERQLREAIIAKCRWMNASGRTAKRLSGAR